MDDDTQKTEDIVEVTPVPEPAQEVESVEVEKPARKKRNTAKAKGNSMERRVAKALSLWLTNGEKNNVFGRSPMSGGTWTSADRRGADTNLPGDIAAASPLAYGFLMHFSIEVKHNEMLVLSEYLLGAGKGYLTQSIMKTAEQAVRAGLWWMFIGKQNRRPTFLITNREAGEVIVGLAPHLSAHWLFNGTTLLTNFEETLDELSPEEFIEAIRNIREPKPAPKPVLVRRPIAVMPTRQPMPRRELRG